MLFETYGDRNKPAVLFFHAMGVTGQSSRPVAEHLPCFCILPTSTVYCAGQRYAGKADEVRQVEDYLRAQGVKRLALVVASSIGADLAMAFLTQMSLPVDHVYFDGGQFAQIGRGTRRVMMPFLYLAIKSLYWSKGKTLKKLLWCGDDAIKPYFIAAGRALTLGNLRASWRTVWRIGRSRCCRRRCSAGRILRSAARRTISSTARRCGRHILRGISLYLRDTTTCSTRSATRRALRSCCRA